MAQISGAKNHHWKSARHQLDSVAFAAFSPDVARRKQSKPQAHVSNANVGYHASTAAPHHLNSSKGVGPPTASTAVGPPVLREGWSGDHDTMQWRHPVHIAWRACSEHSSIAAALCLMHRVCVVVGAVGIGWHLLCISGFCSLHCRQARCRNTRNTFGQVGPLRECLQDVCYTTTKPLGASGMCSRLGRIPPCCGE